MYNNNECHGLTYDGIHNMSLTNFLIAKARSLRLQAGLGEHIAKGDAQPIFNIGHQPHRCLRGKMSEEVDQIDYLTTVKKAMCSVSVARGSWI